MMSRPRSDHSRPHELLSPQDESRAFGRLRYRILSALLRQTFVQARFRVSLILALTGLLWGGMLWIFADGFVFLQSTITHPDTHARTVGTVFGHFFFWLMLMLVFSSGIILYSSLFRSREIAFLLTVPARTERIFLHKFQEAIVLSSWGFALLGSPMLLAYGIVESAPWYYYALLLPFLVAFLYIPVAIGAILCLWLVRYIPDKLKWALVVVGLFLAAGIAWMSWGLLADPQKDLLTPGWYQEILGRMQISDKWLLPSWWLSFGLLNAAAGDWSQSVLFLTLMISNALLFRQLALWTSGKVYRAAYSGLYGMTLRRKRARSSRFDRLFLRLIVFLPLSMRLLFVKDMRLFRRDPLQWSQFLIFLGLLGLYFFNLPSFTYNMYYVGWVNGVSFLNLSVVGLLLSTFTTRFVFPMVSLEGQRFWILGLLGLKRDSILWGKFLFSTIGSLVPCSLLVLLSDLMLKVSQMIVVSHQLTCLVLCLGLSGIAVGLGARFPNLREESPSRIAAGFGGTLNLVVSTLYILVMVLLTALPTHFYLAAEYAAVAERFVEQSSVQGWLMFWLIAGTVASIFLGTAATLVPLRIGLRAFRNLEF